MKKIKLIKIILIVGLMVFTSLAMALDPIRARAEDADGDGYLDTEEEGPIEPDCERNWDALFLDPIQSDAVVLLDEDANSLFPETPPWPGIYGDPTVPCNGDLVSQFPAWYCILTKAANDGGLNFNVHGIRVTDADSDRCPNRNITATQLAARFSEDTFNAVGTTLGWCPQGTFNDPDDCVIYTPRIRDEIIRVCGDRHPSPDCKDQYDNWGIALEFRYTVWVKLHELGHKMTVATCRDETLGGNHHDNHDCIMDRAPHVTTKGQKKTFNIPDEFCAQCRQAVDLSVDDPLDIAACEVVEEQAAKKGGGKNK